MRKWSTLTKEALERWDTIPKAEQAALIGELKAQPGGQVVVELDPPVWVGNASGNYPNGSQQSSARVVSVVFGMNFSKNDKRYLFLSEILRFRDDGKEKGLPNLAARIRQQIATGETEEGGFAVE